MPLRKFLGALFLGLPVAVLSHILGFGGDHALGGSAHGLVVDTSLAAACASMAALLVGAILISVGRCQGSIVAGRLAAFLPGIALLLGTSATLFFAIEAAETAHTAALGTVLLSILVTTVTTRTVAVAAIRAVAALVVLINEPPFVDRPFVARLVLAPAPRTQLCPVVATRFSRPPPLFF